jgi:hypothetical protein
LQYRQISPRGKLYFSSSPVSKRFIFIRIFARKSTPFCSGFFSSYLRPTSPWISQVIR